MGISPADDVALEELFDLDCMKKILARCVPLDCDPQLTRLVQLIRGACETEGAASV